MTDLLKSPEKDRFRFSLFGISVDISGDNSIPAGVVLLLLILAGGLAAYHYGWL